MKLATLEDGSLDGRLTIVSRDLAWACAANDIAPNLLRALELWDEVSEQLEQRSSLLNRGAIPSAFPFDPARAMAPLPRAPQWLDGSAFPSHGERMVKAFGLSNDSLQVNRPLMYQGCSDNFLGARTAVPLPSEEHGIDFEAELAVITANVPMAAPPDECARRIRLLVLVDDVSLRNLILEEMPLGFGMIQCKPTSVLSPVCVTPDELGPGWDGQRVHLNLTCRVNGRTLGTLSASEMRYSFGELIAHAARTRFLAAGTIVGSGTFSNYDASLGVGCLAEARALELLNTGKIATPWLRFGDRVEMEMFDKNHQSLFGAIDHTSAQYRGNGSPAGEWNQNQSTAADRTRADERRTHR